MNNFNLFISSESAESSRMIKRFEAVLEFMFEDNYSLKVINVMKDPHLAAMMKVFATPTLVRTEPLPVKYITGDISGHEGAYKILLKSK